MSDKADVWSTLDDVALDLTIGRNKVAKLLGREFLTPTQRAGLARLEELLTDAATQAERVRQESAL